MQNKETKKTASGLSQKSPLPYIIISITIVLLLVVGFIYFKSRMNNVAYKSITIAGQRFNAEVADTDAKRAKGLSERDGLPMNAAMLFDFKTDGDWRMWMLQMRFPIDIAWLNKDGKIVYIKANAQPGDYPEVYHAEVPSRYAIELPAGTLQKLGVKTGDTVQLQ